MAVSELMRIRFAKDHAHRRQNRNVQNGVELVGNFFGFFEKQGHAAIAQVDDAGGALVEIGEDCVRLGAHQRNAFPFALIAMLLRRWRGCCRCGRGCGP